MIKSRNKHDMQDARSVLDAESGKPDTYHPYPCVCGEHAITIYDDDTDMVACVSCGLVRHGGGTTLRVVREYASGSDWFCDVGSAFEAKVNAAKAKPEKDRTKDEKKLAKLDVVPDEASVRARAVEVKR
jgi:hypothetical protein